MGSKIFLIALLVFVFLTTGLFILFKKQPEKKWGRACFKENCFDVQLAQNGIERAKGLMSQKSLGQNEGMLFLFDKEAKYSFWMKNTLIPLDIIWINSLGEVVFIAENSQPCLEGAECLAINPGALAKYVLEINAGIIEELGITPGSKLDLYY